MALLEGFEVLSGDVPTSLPWTLDTTGTLAQSTSNVTQGTYSYNFSGINAAMTLYLDNYDFSAINSSNTLYVDLHIGSIGALQQASFYMYDYNLDEEVSQTTTAGATGTFTLEIDLNAFSAKNFTDIYFEIATIGTVAGTQDIYWDNFRDDAAGGALTVMDVTDPAEVMGVSGYASVMGVS